MLIITATIPALPPLFQNNAWRNSSSYLLRERTSASRGQGPSTYQASRAVVSRAYVKEPSKESIGTIHDTPTPDQYQRAYDDDEMFLMPLDSMGKRVEVGAACLRDSIE